MNLISATLPNKVLELAGSFMSDPIQIEIKPNKLTSSPKDETNSPSAATLSSKPIGDLQDWCVKHSLPSINYDLTDTSNLKLGQISYSATAKCGSFISIGSGTSKKKAKASAATPLLIQLKDSGFGINLREVDQATEKKLQMEFTQERSVIFVLFLDYAKGHLNSE